MRTPDRSRPYHRRGITLFEALGIFLGAIAAIGQVINVGTLAAGDGQLNSDAVLRCETKLAEIIAGIEPMVAAEAQPFADDARWQWSLTVTDGPHADLLQLDVTATHNRLNGTQDASFTLTRLVRDPQLYLDATGMEVSQ